MNLGENIKNARKSAGLTQVELAKKMDIMQKDVSRWESNARVPSVLSLKKLCEAIGISADSILEIKLS